MVSCAIFKLAGYTKYLTVWALKGKFLAGSKMITEKGCFAMNIKIIVATHKKYWMPDDQIYIPVHVGAEGKQDDKGKPLDLGYVKDNHGENISSKNANYCELTAQYWAWKNLKADYIGMAHYRRHFSNGEVLSSKKGRVITGDALFNIIIKAEKENVQILLPKPRNYWIETNYSQYAHAHHAIDLDKTKEILTERYPDYLNAWETCMKKTTGHRFNMFIMKYEVFVEYCSWLFDILFELERRLDISSYNKNDSRVFGFVSERLLDIWIETKGYKYKELPYVFMENQRWLIKGGNFLKRKFRKNGKE